MMSMQKVGSGRTVRSLLLLAAITCLPQHAAANTEVPQAIIALAPPSIQLSIQSWEVHDADEFGKVGGGQLHGTFPEYRTCAYAMGPEFELRLAFNTAWEASPEQLAMWEEMFLRELDFEGAPERLVESVRVSITVAAGAPVVGAPVVEELPNGHIAYVEFDWKCAANSGGANTKLRGYAIRGATSLQFDFWIYAGREKAIAMATEILAKFEQLDLAELREQGQGD